MTVETTLSRSATEAPEGSRATRRRRARALRRVALGGGALLAVTALAAAFRPKPIDVDTVVAERGDLVVTVSEMAKARVRDRFVVAAPIAGNVLRIELEPGAQIVASSVLARIAPMTAPMLDARSRVESQARASGARAAEQQARTAVTRAELALANAKEELARTEKLVASGSLATDALTRAELEARLRTEELGSARFAAQLAAHEAAMAGAALRRYDRVDHPGSPSETFEVTAPAGGRVLRVLRESAGPVQAGTPLLEIGDPTGLEVVADVLTADAVRMSPGAKVSVERWGGAPLEAHVRAVEPSAFTRVSALGVEEQRTAVVVDLDAPRERFLALGDGYRAEVRIVVAERHGVVHVPLGAAFRHDRGWAAYVVQDGRAVLVPVEIGARSDLDAEVERGIREGDRVLVHPTERVTPGARVRAR
jgi:HlyD family secretion protein